jgi:hypothetical protein
MRAIAGGTGVDDSVLFPGLGKSCDAYVAVFDYLNLEGIVVLSDLDRSAQNFTVFIRVTFAKELPSVKPNPLSPPAV